MTWSFFRQILGRIERLAWAPDLSWGYRTRPTGMSSKERRRGGVFDGCSYQTLRQRVAEALGFTGMTAY